MMNYFLGFDPGGGGKFGWCVCHGNNEKLTLVASGNANHAKGAFAEAVAAVPEGKIPLAAGIDAPLFWVADGGREVDKLVRRAIGRAGSPAPSGTVQHFNSLQGSCVIQGMLIAQLLRAHYPDLPITEAHPKALLWLLDYASRELPAADVSVHAFCDVPSNSSVGEPSEHERDAILGALTAKALIGRQSGWTDLLDVEQEPVRAVDGPLSYWMPLASELF